MNKEILDKISYLKSKYTPTGCIIQGVFGSYARNEEHSTSDIDILYNLSPAFRLKFKGFKAISELDKIKKEIEEYLGIEIDFIQDDTLNKISNKYVNGEFYKCMKIK